MSRMTAKDEKTRPRISRGVFRCNSTERATDEGELKNPDAMTSRIATPIWVDNPYRIPQMPIAVIAMTIQAGSGSLLANLAMKNEPRTNPTEVRPSWRPYWNSVAPRTLRVNGRSRTFHRPNAKNMNAPTTKSERMTGVPNNVDMPDFRLATMTATLASSSGMGIW